jgi:hypothetical protein
MSSSAGLAGSGGVVIEGLLILLGGVRFENQAAPPISVNNEQIAIYSQSC